MKQVLLLKFKSFALLFVSIFVVEPLNTKLGFKTYINHPTLLNQSTSNMNLQ